MFYLSFKNNFLFVLVVFFGLVHSAQAQTEILYTTFAGAPLPLEAVNTCQDSSFINQVRIEVTSDDVNELFVNIDFPVGITYTPGSVNIVSDNGPSSPMSVVDQGMVAGLQSFRIFPDDLDVGDFFILEWGRQGNCDAIAGQQAGDFFKDGIQLEWENMGSDSDMDESVRSYDLLVGSLSLEGEGQIVTSLGSSVMRELTITNGGQGELDEFTFYIIDGVGIMTTQLETTDGTIIPVSSTNGDTLFYTIATTEINEFGDFDNHLENGEQVFLKRTYTVTECDNYSGYGAYWGCNSSICQSTTTLEQATVINNLIPDVDILQIDLNDDYCYNGQNSGNGGAAIIQTFQMTNDGNGEARELFFTLNSFQPGSNTGQNYFDIADDWVIKDQNGIVIGTATHSSTLRTANRRDANCTNAARAISVRYDLVDVMIPAGEFITVEVPTYVQNLGCITNCPSSGVSWYSFSGGWEYKDQCEANNYGNTLKRFNAKATNFKDYLVEMPTDLVDQQCFTLDVDFSRLYTRVKSATEGYNDFIIDLKSTSLTYNGGATITTPFGVVSVTDLGDSIVVRLPSNLSNQSGVMPVELKADCAGQVGGAQTILFSNEVSYNGDENCSLYKHECLSNTYQMHCPAPCPRGGATPKLFTFERITYGLPDSDDNGTPDAGGTVDLDVINVHRAVNGDTILGTWNIYVNPNVFDAVENPTDPNIGMPFNYTYIEFDLRDYPLADCSPDNDPDYLTLFTPVPDAEVIVYPADNSAPIMCTVTATLQDDPDAPTTSNTIAKYDLSSCKSTWEGGDSIVVRAKYVTNASLNNAGFNLYISDNEVYSSYVANPTGVNPSDENKYTCDKFNDFMNVLRIYNSPYMPDPQDINGCTNSFIAYLRQYINVQANNVWFPNEYRSFYIQDRYAVVWPAELEYRAGSARFGSLVIDDANVMQVGDSLIFTNLREFFQPYGGTLLPTDEVQSHNVSWSVDPTCDAEVGAIYRAKFYGENIGNGVNTSTANTTAYRSCDSKFSANISMQYDGPLPFITGGGSVQVYTDTAQWEVLLNNGSNSLAGPNTWFYINDVNGTLADFTLSQGGTAIMPDANGFFQLGDNPAGNSTAYDIEGILIGCGDSEIEVISGFSCSEYPTDLDVLACADTVLLQSTSLPSEVQVSFIMQPTAPMELCMDQTISLRQTSSQAAYLNDPSLSFIVPDGVIMPSTIDVEYPENSGFIEALTPTINGSEWTINFEDHTQMDAGGMPGTIGTLIADERSAVVSFSFDTDCDFLSGTNFIFKGLGDRPCGDPADNSGVRVRTIDLDVQGANKPYTNNFMLDMPAFEGCTPTTVSADIQFVNLSAMMTSDMDSVYITLEENLEFVPGSFMCTNADPTECLVFSYMTTDIAGDETIVLSMPPGGLDIDMPLTTSFTYQVVLGNEDLCGDMKNIMYSVVTNLGDVPCSTGPGGFCPSLAVTLGEQDVNILVKKSVVTFDAETTFCNEASGISYSGGLQLSEVELLVGESLVLDIYCADGSGNPAFYTESITFDGPIAIGEQLDFDEMLSTSCNPLNGVVIQASKIANGGMENCICTEQTLFIAGSALLECSVSMDSPVACNGESNGSATVTPEGGNGGYTYAWDNMETTATATMLDAGLHTVTVTDNQGCSSTCTITITEPSVLSCTAAEDTQVVCNGENTGSATVTPAGGNGGYTYAWDNMETTATATMLDAGIHTVTVTDSENCTTTCMVTIAEPAVLTCTAMEVTTVVCNGESNGSASVTPSGGNGGYTYEWDNSEITLTATMLDAGVHTVIVTDSEGCTTTCMVTITEPVALTCTAAEDTQVVCNGESNGSATVTPTGGNGSNTYVWDNGETTATATMLDAGMHTVTVTDSENCTTTCMVTIAEPVALTCTALEDTPVVCNGESNGSATVAPTGGNGSNTYAWDNGETTATATMLDAGMHTVTVTDSENCTTTCMVTITEPAALTCSIALISDVECNGESNGVATVSASGGNGGYSYAWDNMETATTAMMLDAGIHTVTVTDSENCTTTCMVTVGEPAVLTCTAAVVSNVVCNGESNGSATVTPVGGNGSNTYAWDSGETTATAIMLDAGIHTVTVTDSEACSTTCMVVITEPTALTCSVVEDTPVVCNGQSNGIATVTPMGGTGMITYAWDNGETTATATMLDAGLHTVSVTDANNCLTTCMVTITEPTLLTCVADEISPVICNGQSNGQANVVASGGNGTYTYEWDSGEMTANAQLLDAGLHTVTVTDALNCTTICTVMINEPLVLTCSIGQVVNVDCNGATTGQASVTPLGGNGSYTYVWDNGETTATATMLDAGSHTVTVTDAKDCTTTCTVGITEPIALTCTVVEDNPVDCEGEANGGATVTGAGGTGSYSYLWDNGETTRSATMLTGGMHTVQITDDNDCTTTCTVTITNPSGVSCSVIMDNPVVCFGESNGEATVSALGGTGAYSYTWDNGEITATATMLSSGIHTVTVSDGNDCATSCIVTIAEPDALTCTIVEDTPVVCNGESNGVATVTPTGGNGTNTFLWDNGETTATATMLDAGLHTVTITDSKNCTTICDITIVEPAALICNVTKISDVICNGENNGVASVTAAGGNPGYTYLWDNGETTLTALALDAGVHTVTVTDTKDCTTTCTVMINEFAALACTIVQDSPVACNGEDNGVATITATGGSGGNAYLWDNGENTITATMLSAGLHTVTVTDSNNCTTTCTVTITNPAGLTCMVVEDSPVVCNGESNGVATVSAMGGNGMDMILWDNGETTATATMLDAGNHSVTITDANGCSTSCIVEILEPELLECTVVEDTPVVCNGESNGVATVTPTGGNGTNTFLWDNGETTATATMLDAGLHTVTITDSKNCTTICDVTIVEPAALICNVTKISDVICNGENNGVASVTAAGGNPGYTYLWDNGETTLTALALDAGLHTVTVTDTKDCTTTCTVMINEFTALACTIVQDSPVACNGEDNGVATITSTGGSGSNAYLWDNGENTTTATMLSAGVHTVTVTDSNNCTTTCTVTITNPAGLTCMVIEDSPVVCNGESNGVATVSAMGGNGMDMILWDNGETTATATMLDAGNHSVSITDANGCSTSCIVEILEPELLECTIVEDTPVVCNGESNGVATVTPTGGNGTNTFLWDNGETTSTATMLDAGLHTVTITDIKNCTTICDVMINEPEVLACTTTAISPVTCFGEADGVATATSTGGNGTNVFAWDNGETTATATMLTAGLHTVTVTDDLDCETTCDVTIAGPAELTCSTIENNPVTCNGDTDGSATVSILGGNTPFTISWDNGETTLTATTLSGGEHTVTIIDSKNCQTTCTVTIGEPDVLTCSIVKNNDPLCDGDNGSATVAAFGGNGSFTYLWNNGETTATSTMLPGGTATVTITDAKNCSTTCSLEMVDQVDCITIDKMIVSTTTTSAYCYDVVYDITVDNFGVVAVEYDLTDTTSFDDDITITSATYTSDAVDFFPFALNSSGEWILANNQDIAAGKVDVFTMTVNVCIDLTDGVTGDDMYSVCGGATTNNTFLPNEGLYNTASLDIDNDGVPNEQASDCGDLPYIVHEKQSPTISAQNTDLSYDVTYLVVVENEGGADGSYDLSDIPAFDNDIVINNATFTSTNGLMGTLSMTNGATNVLADDQIIAGGTTDTYTVTFNVTLDLSETSTDGGDNIYSECGSATDGGAPSLNEGLFNTSTLDLDNDETPEEISEACGDLPYIVHEKTGPTISTQNADLSYDVVYSIEVENKGGATGPYSLNDTPNFDDDVVINSASYSADNGLSGAVETMIGTTNVLANNQSLDAGITDTYTVTFNVTIDLNPTSTDGGNNTYEPCANVADPLAANIPQQALLNISMLDTNIDGIPEEGSDACGELPFIVLEKLDPTISDRNADGTYDVTYEVVVSNIGGANGPYDLFDTPQFENDITINNASFTSTNSLAGALSTTNDFENQLADDAILAPNSMDTYTVMFNVTLDLSGTGTDSGDNAYNECGANSGMGSVPFEGLYNIATVDTNNDGTSEQEDDACGDIYIFDLANTKSVDPGQDIILGGEVTYTITVYNQGNINAQNVEVIDYFPTGIDFAPSNDAAIWTYDMTSNTATGLITDVILPGDSATISLIGIVGQGPNWTNITEILSSEDDMGNDTSNSDIDSTPNADPMDDNGDASTDNQVDDDGTTDEDDQDPATIDVFDLAFVKTSITTEAVNIGDVVSFEFKVLNQGNVPAYSIEVTDYIASGFTYDQSINPLWMSTGSIANSTIDGPIAAGDSATVVLNLIVANDGTPSPEDWFNEGEISSADNDEDPNNDPPTDFDSTPDNDPDNDNDVTPGDDNDDETNENGEFGNAGDDEDDNDVSLIQVNGAIGDYVWNDTNADGIQDPSETGIEGVIVNVLDVDGNIVGTDTTDVDGYYYVDNLPPGDYQVQFITDDIVTDYDPSPQNEGDDTLDSDADTDGYTIFTEIVSGEIDTTWDAGFFEPASIGDFVWEDTNGDGIQDPGEPGIEGIVVNLLDADGNIVGTDTTDENGEYYIGNIPPGDYQLQFITDDVVGDYISSPQGVGGNDATDSDIDADGFTIFTTLDPGENDPTWDAGFYENGSISDQVFNDTDADGIQDPGETGIEGVVVNVLDADGNIVGTDTTDENGEYYVGDLPPGDYTVEFITDDLLTDYDPSPQDEGGDDATDSDANEDGVTGVITIDSGEDDDTVDAGFYEPASIGDFVWEDTNADGIQDVGEPGIEGVIVNLLDADGNIVGTDTTDENGEYYIGNIPPGDYQLQFITDDVVGDYISSPQDASGDDTTDSDIDADGFTIFTTLDPGENDPTWDAGFYENGSISNQVFNDTDADGIQDPGETGIEGVVVNVLDADGNIVGTDTTDENGEYYVGDLPPGDYTVEFIIDDLLTDYDPSPQDEGGDDATDSDADATGVTGIITLDSGEDDDTVDAGFYEPAAIGDFVWEDINANGIQDPGEPGIEGVIVNVLDIDGNIVGTDITNENGAYYVGDLPPGDYQVQFIAPDLEGEYEPSPLNVGDDATDSDIDADGFTIFTTLEPGEYDDTWDAGFAPLFVNIGDYVWHDIDGDGIQESGEPGIGGVTVILYNEDNEEIATTITDENGYYLFEEILPDTYYMVFLDPDGYQSTFPNTTNDENDSDITNLIINTGGSSTDLFTVNPGEDDLTIDAGYYMCVPIGETVWYDVDTDNVEDPSENGINGLKVTLWRLVNGTWEEWDDMYTGHKPGTPSDDGYYKFCAPPGTYYLHFQLPPIGLVQAQPNVGSDLLDSDVTNGNGLGTTNSFTVQSGDVECTVGAGFYPMAEVGNFVWEDSNQNGLQEESESPLEGVMVQAFDLDNNVVAEVTTDTNGEYNMEYLQQESYYLKFTPPTGYGATLANAGADDMDSDVTHAYGSNTTNAYALNSGEQVRHVDAGMAFGVLPVEWLYVRAANKGDHNLVEWATATEINSDYFEVERRVGNDPSFRVLERVEAAGMSTDLREYDYNDGDIAQSGVYYYRIKQVDVDGRVDYSDIVSVTIDKVTTTMSLYPNPAINATMIKVNGAAAEDAKVSVYSKDGKLIRSGLVLDEVSSGNYELRIDVSTFLPGVYTVQIETVQDTWTEKLIVIK